MLKTRSVAWLLLASFYTGLERASVEDELSQEESEEEDSEAEATEPPRRDHEAPDETKERDLSESYKED